MFDPMQFDKTKFSTSSYVKKISKPWGYEIHFVPEGLSYMGKIIHINANAKISFQAHDKKQESWYILNGKAKILWENDEGELIETEFENGKGYTTQIGQRHRLIGISECDILEVSTPELGTTYRLEDDYNRPDETEELRKKPNRGWGGK